MKSVTVEDLRVGDLVIVVWLDASRDMARLPDDREVEARIHSWGVFLGVRGRTYKHILLGHAKPPMKDNWDADRIPLPMIECIILVVPGFLNRFLPESMFEVKKITLTSPRKAWKLVRVRVP